MGFRYLSVLEDYFTGFNLHCEGWTSVYFNPPKAAFLGTTTTNPNDLLVQGTRWTAGLVEITISRFTPLVYGSLRMPILHSMCYVLVAYYYFSFFPLLFFATIPQLCLLKGIALYPEVTKDMFGYIFSASNALLEHLQQSKSLGQVG